VAILAAMGHRKTRGIAEAVGRPVHNLGHHGKRLYRGRADAGREQGCRKILWAALGGGGEDAVEAPREHVARPHIVVRRHDEMRQQRLLRRLGTAETAKLVHDAVGVERCQEVELRRAGGGGAAVRQVDDLNGGEEDRVARAGSKLTASV
jgi:hypothetical protein